MYIEEKQYTGLGFIPDLIIGAIDLATIGVTSALNRDAANRANRKLRYASRDAQNTIEENTKEFIETKEEALARKAEVERIKDIQLKKLIGVGTLVAIISTATVMGVIYANS